MEHNDLKDLLKKLSFGEIGTVAMIDRGAYAESEENVEDRAVGSVAPASTMDRKTIKSWAMELKNENEDLTIVGRSDMDVALVEADFEQFIDQLRAERHIIFVECLYLGTTEIKGFLNSLKNSGFLETSKLVLLDVPPLEYMMIKDSLAGQLDL